MFEKYYIELILYLKNIFFNVYIKKRVLK